MKLKFLTPETCIATRGKEAGPMINFKKRGFVTINGAAASLVGLKAGQQVVLVQDEDEPENWYLLQHKEGWPLRPVKTSQLLAFQASGLVQQLYASLGIDTDKLVKMRLAGQPTKVGKDTLWGILTVSANWTGKK